jgi:CRISPR system Cascade subunit CasE
MYLTRLLLDPTHPQARRDLASAYEMHRTLSRAFVDSPEGAPRRFLWRLEAAANGAANGPATVLVQSATEGRWPVLNERAGYLCAAAAEKEVDLERLLQAGRLCVFRLLCNPTVTRDGKRVGLWRENDLHDWLRRQGTQHGLEPAAVRVGRNERASVRQGRDGHRITVQIVQFDGVLRITDAERLGAALVNGIGHAKAIGLGMLSLAPQAGRIGSVKTSRVETDLEHAHL